MDIGIFAFLTDHTMDVVPLAQGVEELGFESLWVPEHPIMPVHTTSRYPGSADGVIPKSAYRLTDPFVTLARASAVTSRIKLGTGIVLVPERNPLLLAKEIATLDMYSGGRFLFGIGAGWCREETEMMGGDFDHRWGQTREAILAMKELWTADAAEYHGRFYDFPLVYSFPKPVRQPHPPVHLGGNAPKVLERVVAWGDGWLPYVITVEEVKRARATLDELALAAGRDPASIEITLFANPNQADLVKRYRDAGANRVLIGIDPTDEQETLSQLGVVAETMLA